MNISEDQVNTIVKDILKRLVDGQVQNSTRPAENAVREDNTENDAKSEHGVFNCIDSAVKSAKEAQSRLM